MPYLEDVFLVSGIPTHTFVEPVHYDALRLSLRTPGRCAVIEGPSGIGKTTSIYRLLEEQERLHAVTFLSARKGGDIEYINALPTLGALGTVIVDDFHRLPDDAKATLADFMKVLADEGSSNSKLILIGINKAGDRLVHVGNDLGLRIDVFKMESNPDYKIEELISKGETALNIDIANGDAFVQRSYGSFQIAQMLCRSLCVDVTISETCGRQTLLSTSIEAIIDLVMVDLRRMFSKQCIEFARGSKLRREGRAPYLHILRWLSETDDWSLDLRQAVKMRPEHKGSVGP